MSDDHDYCHIDTFEEDLARRIAIVLEAPEPKGICVVFHYKTETMEMVDCGIQLGVIGG